VNCELCERPAADAYLCDGCTQDTAERLEGLPSLFEQLADMLIPQGSPDGGRRGSRLIESPSPDLDVIDHRAAFAVLPSWHRALFDAPGWPQPSTGLADLDGRMLAACMALRASVEWVAASWPAAGDFAREVRDLHDDARSVVGAADLDARMGLCPAVVGGVVCGALLRLPYGQQVVRCDWCSATYPPGVWAALRREQARAFSPSEVPA